MKDDDAAIQMMVNAYVDLFKEQPDRTTRMLINASASRVANGEQFTWTVDGVWRKLTFGGNDVQC